MLEILLAQLVRMQGGLSNGLVAGLVGDRVIDAFTVADNNGIAGQLLRDLIGPAFDVHRSLQTMTAVAASTTAMTAVIASATAMTAVAASATAMTAVAASATTMTAVAASATAMTAVAASLTARSAVRLSATAINAINASQLALDAMYTAATKFTYTPSGTWSANPATLAAPGNYLIVRFIQVTQFWGAGVATGQYFRRGDGSTWTMTDGDSTANIPARAPGTRRDNALRTVNGMSIQYHVAESFEFAWLTA